MAKNFKNISDAFIDNANLLRLDLHYLGQRYLEKVVSYFMKIIIEDEIWEIAKELKVSNSKEEKKRQASLWKEKKNTWATACLSTIYLREVSAAILVSGLFALTTSAGFTRSVEPMCGSLAPYVFGLVCYTCTWFVRSVCFY